MVEISKAESKVIAERLPRVYIVRTMASESKRGHYFCEESKAVTRLLDELRNANVVEAYGRWQRT